MDSFVTTSAVSAIALVVVHFLWQGLVVWAAVSCLLYVVRPRRAQTRYAIYCATLVVLAACPAATLWISAGDSMSARVARPLKIITIDSAMFAIDVSTDADSPGRQTAWWMAIRRDVRSWIDRFQSAIALAWLAGAACFAARLAAGGIKIWTLARTGNQLTGDWSARIDQLAARMRFHAAPSVRVVRRISQAMVVGVIRPVVLLPAA